MIQIRSPISPALLSALAFLTVGCSDDREAHSIDAHEIHWGYEGEGGPDYWADLKPEFLLCVDGTEQSPVDLTGAVPVESADLARQLGKSVLTGQQRARVMDIVDNGHTIQVTNDIPMSLEIRNTLYELVQYHFHAPSEHMIAGMHAPLEVHFVHKSATGDLAVVGILVDEGAYDAIWEPVLANLPDDTSDERHIEGLDLDMDEVRPLPQRYYVYDGSLTTPPCSEGVQWIVMAEKRQISSEQMDAIVSHLHENNRPVQPHGGREIGLVSNGESPADD